MSRMEKRNRPNILWIMTDQQSAGMMGCMGNPYVRTPHMDYLAREGVLFERTYCTNPVCLPSRFSLFTGLYPSAVGIRSNAYKRESDGLPEKVIENGLGRLLKKAGYDAVYAGKEHLPFTDAAGLGFTYLSGDEGEEMARTCASYIESYSFEKPLFMASSFINPHDICLMAIRDYMEHMDPEEAEGMKRCFPDAIRLIEELERIPEDMAEDIFYETVCPPLPDNYLPSEDEPEAIRLLQEERIFKKLARQEYTDNRWRLHRYLYARLTELVDRQIGIILKALKKSGHYDDTVIIFTSDHGDMDAAHKMEHKECLYEEACHVPLIIKGSNRFPGDGSRNKELVCNGTDLFVTVLDYAQIPVPAYLSGYSLREEVQGGHSIPKRNYVVIECENGIGAVGKTGKYVRYDKGREREQFYYFPENQGEAYNQIGESRFREEIDRMKAAVDLHFSYIDLNLHL